MRDTQILHTELLAVLGKPSDNNWYITNGVVFLSSQLEGKRAEVDAVVLLHESNASCLQRQQNSTKTKLFQLAEQVGAGPYKNVTRMESDSWAAKGAEFDAFQLDATANCPILVLESQLLGLDFIDFMTLQVGPKVTEYRKLVASVKATQSLLEKEIDTCINLEELALWVETMEGNFESSLTSILAL